MIAKMGAPERFEAKGDTKKAVEVASDWSSRLASITQRQEIYDRLRSQDTYVSPDWYWNQPKDNGYVVPVKVRNYNDYKPEHDSWFWHPKNLEFVANKFYEQSDKPLTLVSNTVAAGLAGGTYLLNHGRRWREERQARQERLYEVGPKAYEVFRQWSAAYPEERYRPTRLTIHGFRDPRF